MGMWSSLIRPRVKPLVYRLRSKWLYRAASFYVNTVDNDHDSDWWTNGEAAFARARLPGAKLVFDVGAAVGDWTAIALESDPDLMVHCFEPTNRRFSKLAARGFGSRVVLNRLGLGDAPTEAQIFHGAVGGSNTLFSQQYPGTENHAQSETIQISTIDRYCREHGIDHVDFIKMDIEGYEMAAIRGAEQMLRAGKIDVIQFEYSYLFIDAGTSLMQLMRYVNEINPRYEFHKILPTGTRPITKYKHELDNFKTQNWALIRR